MINESSPAEDIVTAFISLSLIFSVIELCEEPPKKNIKGCLYCCLRAQLLPIRCLVVNSANERLNWCVLRGHFLPKVHISLILSCAFGLDRNASTRSSFVIVEPYVSEKSCNLSGHFVMTTGNFERAVLFNHK